MAVEVPDEGPMTFEFDIEVRPEFELPKWKGLTIEKPVREFTPDDVDKQLQEMLGPARPAGALRRPGGRRRLRHSQPDVQARRRGCLERQGRDDPHSARAQLPRRQDREVRQADDGVKAGETREGEAKLTHDAPNVALRGKKITAMFEVLEVKKLELPELTPELLEELGGFETKASCATRSRTASTGSWSTSSSGVPASRSLAALTEAADWDLPPEMLQRQSGASCSGACWSCSAAVSATTKSAPTKTTCGRTARASTARALKEHFILERIAEEEKIEVAPSDYDDEIALIAEQSGESARRVRAQLEKRGLMDSAAEPDHRAEGDRPDPGERQVQGSALQARGERRRGGRPIGRRGRRGRRHSRSQVRREAARARNRRNATRSTRWNGIARQQSGISTAYISRQAIGKRGIGKDRNLRFFP